MKKIFAVMMVAMVITTGTATAAFAAEAKAGDVQKYPAAKVTVDGQTVQWKEMQPVNMNGTIFVPVREALEAFGQKVTWDASKPKTVVTDDPVTGLHAVYDLESPVVTISQLGISSSVTMSAVPVVLQEKTMVPIRALTDVYGKKVSYDVAAATVQLLSYNSDNTGDTIPALKESETYDGYIGDVVRVHYATDGTYDYQPTANANYRYLGKNAEGVGNYSMYFKALKAGGETSIVVNKVSDGKVAEALTYKTVLKNPADAATMLSDKEKTATKQGTYVKVVLSEQGASTGYEWVLTSCSSGLTLIDKQLLDAKSDLIGAPRDVVFVFRADGQGEQTVLLDQKRAWEEGSAVQVKFTMEITK